MQPISRPKALDIRRLWVVCAKAAHDLVCHRGPMGDEVRRFCHIQSPIRLAFLHWLQGRLECRAGQPRHSNFGLSILLSLRSEISSWRWRNSETTKLRHGSMNFSVTRWNRNRRHRTMKPRGMPLDPTVPLYRLSACRNAHTKGQTNSAHHRLALQQNSAQQGASHVQKTSEFCGTWTTRCNEKDTTPSLLRP